MLLTPAQIKPQSFESRQLFFLFLPGVDAPRVYVRAWALGCFHSTRNFRRALTALVDSCAEIKSALQWRNQIWQNLEEGAGKRCSECAYSPAPGNECSKAVLLKTVGLNPLPVPATQYVHPCPCTEANVASGQVLCTYLLKTVGFKFNLLPLPATQYVHTLVPTLR